MIKVVFFGSKFQSTVHVTPTFPQIPCVSTLKDWPTAHETTLAFNPPVLPAAPDSNLHDHRTLEILAQLSTAPSSMSSLPLKKGGRGRQGGSA
jgi:hypothetical protein